MATLRPTRTDVRSIGTREVNNPHMPSISDEFNRDEVSEVSISTYSQRKHYLPITLMLMIICLFIALTCYWYPPNLLAYILQLILYFGMGFCLCAFLYYSLANLSIKELFK